MRSVNIQAAKTHLSRLVDEAARGEDIVIAKAGRAMVRLVPVTPATTPRVLGGWRGRVRIPADFDAPDDEVARLFAAAVGTDPLALPPRVRKRKRAKSPR